MENKSPCLHNYAVLFAVCLLARSLHSLQIYSRAAGTGCGLERSPTDRFFDWAPLRHRPWRSLRSLAPSGKHNCCSNDASVRAANDMVRLKVYSCDVLRIEVVCFLFVSVLWRSKLRSLSTLVFSCHPPVHPHLCLILFTHTHSYPYFECVYVLIHTHTHLALPGGSCRRPQRVALVPGVL